MRSASSAPKAAAAVAGSPAAPRQRARPRCGLPGRMTMGARVRLLGQPVRLALRLIADPTRKATVLVTHRSLRCTPLDSRYRPDRAGLPDRPLDLQSGAAT